MPRAPVLFVPLCCRAAVPPTFPLPSPLKTLNTDPPMSTEAKPNRSKNPLDFDFTEPEALARYVTETGKILPRKLTGLNARQQRHITKAIKRGRSMLSMQ